MKHPRVGSFDLLPDDNSERDLSHALIDNSLIV